MYQTLRNSRHTVATIDEADVIYVYDYCYMMWILSDHHARQHWWLRDNYQPELKTGSYLLSSYRYEPVILPRRVSLLRRDSQEHSLARMQACCIVPPGDVTRSLLTQVETLC